MNCVRCLILGLCLGFITPAVAAGAETKGPRKAWDYCESLFVNGKKRVRGAYANGKAKFDEFQRLFKIAYAQAERAHRAEDAARAKRESARAEHAQNEEETYARWEREAKQTGEPWKPMRKSFLKQRVRYVLGLIGRTFSRPKERGLFNERAIWVQRNGYAYQPQRGERDQDRWVFATMQKTDAQRMIRRIAAKLSDTSDLWAYEVLAPLALFEKGRFLPRIYDTGTIIFLTGNLVVGAVPILEGQAMPERKAITFEGAQAF